MELWQEILNTALLGTDKRLPATGGFPPVLQEAAAQLTAGREPDKEEQFLQLTSLVFNYRQCGVAPLRKETVGIEPAVAEERPYCSVLSMQVLKDILEAESIPLLTLWLQHCSAAAQIVQPDLLPSLLALGAQHKKLQPVLGDCCGKRGAWLSRFNPDWNFSIDAPDEEVWQTGTLEQRKTLLHAIRAVEPARAREWLQQTWAQEDASTKASLLELLSVNIGQEDIAFLESLSTEKSKKVKELALVLLKRIPLSPVVQQYQQLLRQAVVVKKDKALLGLSHKTAIEWQLPIPVEEAIYKTGIEKLSNQKGVPDEEFILYQLVQSAPPSFWEDQLACDAAAVIGLLGKSAIGKRVLKAMVDAVINFNDHRWALAYMQHAGHFYVNLFPLLSPAEQEQYGLASLSKAPDSIIDHACQRTDEWGLEFTRQVFKHTSRNPYQYNRTFYNQHIERFPAAIVGELEQFTPPEDGYKTMWSNISPYIRWLIELKQQIIQSFNAIK